tara:strand:+ start:123 stop:554 length:432 start_codon:yes stop_codon:yes gene_type:complete
MYFKKYLFIFILFLFVSCFFSQAKRTDGSSFNRLTEYKILKIDSINNFYLIYATKADTLFKIVSEKKFSDNCRKIIIGKDYSLNLESIWRKEVMIGDVDVSPSKTPHVSCLYLNEITKVCLEGDSIRDIYETKNLEGLCYLPK